MAAEGSIEKLNGVDNGRFLMAASKRGLKLKDATRIAGGDDVGGKL